ncbi:hypothetical protein AKJ09_07461 [Labilithrix luteola]|uniref:Uncharacterized protein n=1 Tax=Labilithrix luteola TaxID=1391654 RepID=A0A0K1Q4Z2_9BACT|nr:hypothetical protein [Labilithrix luteola]AKV00798.1 hypothetical protein AKJ09_07461 [Labilithrix luteola]
MRSIFVATALAISTLAAVPAFAAPSQGNAPAQVQHGDKGDQAKFPMPGAEFKQKVDARTAKARAHMEERAAKLPADQAKDLRTKFDAGTAQINDAVNKAIADGTVTKEEAQQVREVVKSVRPHHGKHARSAKK